MELELAIEGSSKDENHCVECSVGCLGYDDLQASQHLATRASCTLCGVEADGSFHALISCKHARSIWERMTTRRQLPADDRLVKTGKDWLLNVLHGYLEEVPGHVIMLIWRIWQPTQ